jgi:hypothetical protein
LAILERGVGDFYEHFSNLGFFDSLVGRQQTLTTLIVDRRCPMWKSKKSIWQRIGEFAGLVAIIGVLVTLVQLSQSIGDSRSQASSQSTQIALLQEQLGIQQEIATLQVGASGAGPISTAIAQRIIELESTRIALATKEAGIQHAESDQTMQIQAGTEWVSTGLIVSPGE